MKNLNLHLTPLGFQKSRVLSAIMLIVFCFLMIGFTQHAQANPRPGDVFREYHLIEGGSNGEP